MNVIKIAPEWMRGQNPSAVQLCPGAYIAGGSVRRWFTGEKQSSDIDVFFCNQEAMDLFIVSNTGINDKSLLSRTNNADTYRVRGVPIQLIKLFHETIDACFDSFDFCHCQFAYDGTDIFSTVEGITCALRKHLAIHKVQKGFELDTLRRAFKYNEQGYRPCIGTMQAMALAFINAEQPQEETINNQAEISPGGGRRVRRFD